MQLQTHRIDPSRPPSPIIISLNNVSMVYDGHVALENVSLNICHGDFIAITGPNGGGKTTLLRIILRLLKPTSGRINYYNGTGGPRELHIGYLPQKNLIDSRFPITVNQVVTSGLLNTGLPADEQRRRVEETLAMVDMTAHRDAAIGTLSGGQLQRTLLGRALVGHPSVIVLDEPLSYVDKYFENRIYDIIADLASHTTIILVSHEMSRIASMATRHLIVNTTVTHCTASHHYFRTGCL